MSDVEVAHIGHRVRVDRTGEEGVVKDYREPFSYLVLLDSGEEVTVYAGGLTNLDFP